MKSSRLPLSLTSAQTMADMYPAGVVVQRSGFENVYFDWLEQRHVNGFASTEGKKIETRNIEGLIPSPEKYNSAALERGE